MGPGKTQTLEESLWDVAIFTLGGCPGALVRAAICHGVIGIALSNLSRSLVRT